MNNNIYRYNISDVFNIPKDYTLEQLKDSYVKLVNNILNSDRIKIEKDMLINQYKLLYIRGKELFIKKLSIETDIEANYNINNTKDYSLHNRLKYKNPNIKLNDLFYNSLQNFDNVFNEITNNFENRLSPVQKYSYSTFYKSTTNSDGSQTIIESKSESNNGDKKRIINAYKKMPDGKIIPFTEDEIKQIDNDINNNNNYKYIKNDNK